MTFRGASFRLYRGLAAASIAAVLSSGCVTSQEIKPAAKTTLVVTRAGDVVNMQWQSQGDAVYSILYADSIGSGSRWQPLPQATRLRGTGGLIQVQDRPPAGRPRYYDVQVELPR